ncbi:DUF2628 domain-containing protein [Bosea caraganae]|uniref:DUF2628 domain-containing protein n=1 Tax=Bosea caraganae TaxID=2763117 RepID=A0A370L8Q2_9HYPH|nr:DUF2628 domain-containing protein [Bosea caraganae]RDJ26636.1 DUF2628 domain-containing protein [Bosea caraganae]RDJ30522.1 DUF2628 domain-containing protein [Bosea caraganae]
MAFYTVMIPPPGAGGEREEIERAQVLPESFTWSAFVFTGLWLLSKRLWLATILFALVWGALYYARTQLGLTTGAALLAQFAIGLFLGLEGQNLIARKLQRQGWRLADVVEAPDLGSAERRFFERALETRPTQPAHDPLPPATRYANTGPLPVIGLFPEARGR